MNHRVSREVTKIAEDLIREHHQHLRRVRIEFLFSDKSTTSGGQDVFARTQKISGLAAFLAGGEHPENEYPSTWIGEDQEDDGRAAPFFVMVVAEPLWRDLEPNQQRALIDHELCHCEIDGETEKISVRGHFIEEFPEIIKRHGFWRREVEVMHEATGEAEASRQLSLDTEYEDEESEEVEERELVANEAR